MNTFHPHWVKESLCAHILVAINKNFWTAIPKDPVAFIFFRNK